MTSLSLIPLFKKLFFVLILLSNVNLFQHIILLLLSLLVYISIKHLFILLFLSFILVFLLSFEDQGCRMLLILWRPLWQICDSGLYKENGLDSQLLYWFVTFNLSGLYTSHLRQQHTAHEMNVRNVVSTEEIPLRPNYLYRLFLITDIWFEEKYI